MVRSFSGHSQWLVLWAVCWLAACAGDGLDPDATGTPSADFSRVQREIFNPTCAVGACHDAQTQAGGLNLSEGVSYDLLVDVLAANEAARQRGQHRVLPFEPDQSFLLLKLTNPTGDEGARMPFGADPLSNDKIALIRRWITEGAGS